MSPEAMEMLWMGGCASVMVLMGVLALAGYLRQKQGLGKGKSESAE